MSRWTFGALLGLGLLAALPACGGGKDAEESAPPAQAASSPAPAAAPAAPAASPEDRPFVDLFHGVKLVRLPASEGGDAYQVILPVQSDADPIPNGPVEVRISAGGQEIYRGIPRPLYRCPRSIRSLRFKVADPAQGLKVALHVADPKAVPPGPQARPAAEPGRASGGGGAAARPATPEQAGIDPGHPGAAQGLPVGAEIPGLSAEVPAEALKALKVPAPGERLVRESCG